MDALKKIEMMKKGREMSPMEKKAKMGIMKDIQEMASKSMGGKLDGLKKVTVAGSSPEAVEEGLDKAKEIVSGSSESSEESPSEINESPDSDEYCPPEQEIGNDEIDHFNPFAPKKGNAVLSHEEIDAKIKELLMQKHALDSKKS